MRLRCRACAPGSLTQRVLCSQTILLDTNEHRCNTASLQSPVEKPLASRSAIRSALYPSVATSYRIVEHHYTAIYALFPSATHHSVTSIPSSAGRTPPALSLALQEVGHCRLDGTRAGLCPDTVRAAVGP